MSTWVVKCLDPFRKADCKLGRIATTDDFKHLARKVSYRNYSNRRTCFYMCKLSSFVLYKCQRQVISSATLSRGDGCFSAYCSYFIIFVNESPKIKA